VNKLDRPTYDDSTALDTLASNRRVASYPRLKRHVLTIKNGYRHYLAAHGNVSRIGTITLPKITAKFLRKHYASPPQALSYITQMRERSDSKTCPMCGSLHSGTLDHLMDKADHPAFAIFSLNLVPACKCNSKRSKNLVGSNPGERILHPYFDTVLAERIVAAHFTDLGPVPQVTTRVILDSSNPNFDAAVFHHNSIITHTSIKMYQMNRWSKLMELPQLIIRELKIDPTSRANLIHIIERERDFVDRTRESKNNWDSIFLSGLLDDNVIDWLYRKFTTTGRRCGTSLL